jgi:hypothetical protein
MADPLSLAISVGISLGTAAISSLFAPGKGRQIIGKQESFSRLPLNYGEHIPRVWGKVRVPGIIRYAKLPPQEVVQSTRGGKGGRPTTDLYTYYGDCVVIWARELTHVDTIWFNAHNYYNLGQISPEIASTQFRHFFGSQTTIDSLISELSSEPTPERYKAGTAIEGLPLEKFGNQYPAYSAIVRNGSPNLDDIILDICVEEGFDPADLDLTELSAIAVNGFRTYDTNTGIEKLSQLQQAYPFEVVDNGQKLKFVTQYRPTISAFIDLNSLAAHDAESERPELFEEPRTETTALPSQVIIKFPNLNDNYQPGQQSSFKIGEHENIETIDTQVVLTDSQALTIANQLIQLAWLRRTKFTLFLQPRFCFLEGADVVQAPFHGINQSIQIDKINRATNGVIAIEAWAYDGSISGFSYTSPSANSVARTSSGLSAIALGQTNIFRVNGVRSGATTFVQGVDYTANLAAGTITPISGGAITSGTNLIIDFQGEATPKANTQATPSMTTVRVIDCNKAYDSDGDSVYVFVDGDDAWKSANLWISKNGGSSYDFASTAITRSQFGDCSTTLANGATPDTTNTLDVVVPTHVDLITLTDADLDAGKNLALVGLEICQYKTATLISSTSTTRTYRLSNWRRGLRGTAALRSTHASGEKFYSLSDYKVNLPIVRSDIGKTYLLKALSPGQSLGDVTAVSLTIVGRTFNPLVPVITDFSPRQGLVGDQVTIFGAGFTGATAAKIGTIDLTSVTVVNDGKITGTVASGTSTAAISITSPLGVATSVAPFIVGTPSTATISIKEEGGSVGSATEMNFIGTGVTATVSGSTANITIPGNEKSSNTQSISATLTLTLSSAYFQFLNPTVTPVIVKFPALTTGDYFEGEIINTSNGSKAIQVQENDGTDVIFLSSADLVRSIYYFWDSSASILRVFERSFY